MSQETETDSFWDHLDALRSVLIRIVVVTLACGIAAFIFKEELFDFVFAPRYDDFITYRWLGSLAALFSGTDDTAFSVNLINTGLAQQFMIHVKTALCAGVVCASPYVVYELFRFISPALYQNERAIAVKGTASGYLMFIVGVAFSYFLIFPLTFRFLATYQVSADVENLISLESYISTFIMMSLSMGVVFEMPVLCWILARAGILTADFMRKRRKHAIVVILVAAAIITPTSDALTLLAVSLPMWILFEAGIIIAARTNKNEEF